MVYPRGNGKFFSDPIKAESIKIAFLLCVRTLEGGGFIKMDFMDLIVNLPFNTALKCADEPLMTFMEKRMDTAAENDIRMIFSIFDIDGWRFFGRA
jgi:hypothetical protein